MVITHKWICNLDYDGQFCEMIVGDEKHVMFHFLSELA